MSLPPGKPIAEHIPCWECSSSDAAAIYQDPNDLDRFYGKCYSNNCTKQFTEKEAFEYLEDVDAKTIKAVTGSRVVNELPKFVENPREEVIRGISADTLNRYKVDWKKNAAGEKIAHTYRYLGRVTDDQGVTVTVPVAIKNRYANKHFVWEKLTATAVRDCGFFGQGADFRPSKFVMVTEGEIDAMSAYQMLESKMPVVSLKNGAQDLKINAFQKEYLDKFEVIYVCFDADDAGEKAAKLFSQAFPPEKVRIVRIEDGCKDANDALMRGKKAEFNFSVSIAKSVIKEGFILGRDTLDFLFQDPPVLTPYPWKGLNDMCYGVSDGGELITILSGSGLGKSTIMKTLGLYWYGITDYKIGTLFLEESTDKDTVPIMTGMSMGKNMALPDINEDMRLNHPEELKEAWAKVFDNDRWVLWDFWGSNSTDTIIDTIRYMVVNFGCKIILLDHISIVFSGGTHGGDERKAIDELMTRLAQLVTELGFICVAISHLTKGGDSTPHEEGGRVKLSHARGAGSIYQLSHTVLGLERNGQDDNKALRNITSLRVLKSRRAGETGPACKLAWSKSKGQVRELLPEDYQQLLEILDPDDQIAFLEGYEEGFTYDGEDTLGGGNQGTSKEAE